MKLNNVDEVCNSANSFLSDLFGLLSSEILLPWQRDVTAISPCLKNPMHVLLALKAATFYSRLLVFLNLNLIHHSHQLNRFDETTFFKKGKTVKENLKPWLLHIIQKT